jgi:LPXTG-site transpeptidase (sortase) family protein
MGDRRLTDGMTSLRLDKVNPMVVRNAPPRHSKATARRRRPAASVLVVLGELLLTTGFFVLLYAAYVLWGTGIQTDRAQEELREQIAADWPDRTEPMTPPTDPTEEAPTKDPTEEVQLGDAYAVLSIPRFGADWSWVVIEGVRSSDLARGPGHYQDSAGPGEFGNLAIAGHRAGHGAPFANLDQLNVGDTVELKTANGTWTYTVDIGPRIIDPTDTWVVAPVPGKGSNAAPTERRITLTTCHPRYGSSQRLYVSGVLSDGPKQ